MKKSFHIDVATESVAIDCLCDATGLSKSALKDCLNKGGVWLKRRGVKERRIRKAKFPLRLGDRLSVYYDDEILRLTPPPPLTIHTTANYSVWHKPAGLLSQGTKYGDHCSLLRIVEKSIGKAFLIHRLDREAEGLVVIAHSSAAASQLSLLFTRGCVEKRYRATVVGLFASCGDTIRINNSLDGKKALTEVTVVGHDNEKKRTHVDILLHTGRYHQIRRHLSGMGYPLVGDYRYGEISGKEPLRLVAYSLAFTCPFSGKKQVFRVPTATAIPS